MKRRSSFAIVGLLTCLLPFTALSQDGQAGKTGNDPQEVRFSQRSLRGPRVGITMIPGNSELGRALDEREVGRIISQFGWHFEHRVVANSVGPALVIEFVPLLGGVEYGSPLLSLTLLFGIRTPEGFEFGVGPNAILATGGGTGLVIGAGKTFDLQGISIPVNLAYVTSPVGGRLAFMVGYAI